MPLELKNFLPTIEELENELSEKMINNQHDLIQQLVLRRKQLKISQQKLADMISIPQSTIARIEAEVVTPRLDTIICIANALSVKIDIIEI